MRFLGLLILLLLARPLVAAQFIRGDSDGSGVVDISDAVRTFGFLFLGDPDRLDCEDAADSDDSGELEITDGIYTLGFLFLGSLSPRAPFPDCGIDPSDDALPCSVPLCELPPPPVIVLRVESHSSPLIVNADEVRLVGRATLNGTPVPGVSIETVVESQHVEPIAMTNESGTFEVLITLSQNARNRIHLTAIESDGARSPTYAFDVVEDSAPPTLFVDAPAGTVTSATVTVLGRVGDQLSGFLGLTVTVDGEPAQVVIGVGPNGTFERRGVPLALGPNVVTVVARDAVGNESTREVTVERRDLSSTSARMRLVGGDTQDGQVNRMLEAPLEVLVERRDGSPFAGKVVSFEVVRSDGALSADAGGEGAARSTVVRTDADGLARAFWRLGSDAGCGNNRVAIRSAGVDGSILACASAAPGPATQINVGSGNAQRGEVNGPATAPLAVWVNDSCNGIAGVDVEFRVVEKGGRVDGRLVTTVRTDATGHAGVDYTFGPDPGRQTVSASFAGNGGLPVRFQLQAVAREELAPTTFSGVVLNNSHQPVAGAECSLHVAGHVPISTTTAPDGSFAFDEIAGSGSAELFVHGESAPCSFAGPDQRCRYPHLVFEMTLVPSAANSLPTAVLLPKLDPRNDRLYDGTATVELEVAGVQGIRMIVEAGTAVTLEDGTVIDGENGNSVSLSLNQVHHDEVPMPMPDGVAPAFAWTLQPAGARFDPPLRIEYPNMSSLAPGTIGYFLSYDHASERFDIVASGAVTADGTRMMSDPGTGISLAGWGCNCPPYAVTGDCGDCRDLDFWTRARETAEFVAEVALEFIGAQQVLRCAIATGLAANDCASTWSNHTVDGRLRPGEAGEILSCVNGAKAAAIECSGIITRKASALARLARAGRIYTHGFDGAIAVARDRDCLPRGEDQALGQLALANNLLSGTLDFIGESNGKARAASALCTLIGLASDGLNVNPDGDPGDLLVDFELLNGLFDQILELSTELQDVDALESILDVQIDLDELTTGLDTLIVETGTPDLADFLVTVNGQTVQADENGSFFIPNVTAVDIAPADGIADELVRLTGVKDSPEGTLYAFSEFFQIIPGLVVTIPEVTVTPTPPRSPDTLIAELLGERVLTEVGATSQLRVLATYEGEPEPVDVTTRESWTLYRSSNPAIATVGENGLVTAVASGDVFVTAMNEGAVAVARLAVSLEGTTTLEGFVEREDGMPLADALVTTNGGFEPIATDEAGFFRFEGLPASRETLDVFVRYEPDENVFAGRELEVPTVRAGVSDAGLITVRRIEFIERFDFDEDGVLPSDDEDITLFANRSADGVYVVEDGLLKQRSFGRTGNFSFHFREAIGAGIFGGDVDPTRGMVHEARIKVVRAGGSFAVYIEAYDGTRNGISLIAGVGWQVLLADGAVGTIPFDALDDQFHTYRVESPGSSDRVFVFIDDCLVFDGLARPFVSDGFSWGDGHTASPNWADADWDFVRFAQWD